MLKKIWYVFLGLCVLSGFMLIFCTASASDCELISFNQILIQSAIASTLILGGLFGLMISERIKQIRK